MNCSVALRLGVVAVAAVATLPPTSNAQGRKDDGEAREAWSIDSRSRRADVSGTIPPNAAVRAWQGVQQLPVAPFVFGADAAWRSIGPKALFSNPDPTSGGSLGQLEAGRVTSIAIDPRDSRTLFVGSASGGVWKSTSGGASWSPVSDGQCSLAIGAVAIDPANPNVVYAGTGEINTFEVQGCGILRSTDGGNSWSAVASASTVGPFIGRLLVTGATAGNPGSATVMAATSPDLLGRNPGQPVGKGGLLVSVNGGGTWVVKVPGICWTVVAHPTEPATFYAAVYDVSLGNTYIWRSRSSGLTWTREIVFPGLNRIELAASPAAPNALFGVVSSDDSKIAGVFRWDTFQQQGAFLAASGLEKDPDKYPFTMGEQGTYDLAIAVDPGNADRIWVAGVGAFVSEDGGRTFRSTARSVHVDWHAIQIDPADSQHLLAGTDGGVYASFDRGRSWTPQNNGLAIAQFYPGVSVHPSGLWVYGGLQDNDAAYFSGSLIWNNIAPIGDGGYTAVNPSDPRTVFVAHPFQNRILRMRGSAAELRRSGIGASDRSGSPRPMVMSPTNPSTLYFGTQYFYRTTDEGQSWQKYAVDLTRGRIITAIAVAPSNSQYIYTASNDGVFGESRDGGNTFTKWQFQTSLGLYFTRIAVNPSNPSHVVATSAAYGSFHVIETRDGGANWSNISGNLPDVPVHSVLFIPGTSTIMIGTDFGVLQTVNGSLWTQGPPGLPSTQVYDLVYVPTTSTVMASTYGRGMFAYRLGSVPAVLRGDVDRDGRVTAQDALLIQQGLVGIELTAGRTLFPNGDANCDGKLESLDVVLTLRAAVNLPTPGQCVGTMLRPGFAPPQTGTLPPAGAILQPVRTTH